MLDIKKGGEMKVSEKGLNIIKESESLQLKAYKCPAGILTIGYGHTGPDVLPGMTINQVAADVYLKLDCAVAEHAINRLVKIPLNQNQFDALVSLVFNIGTGAFQRSTLLKRINEGDFGAASDEFLKWTKSKGKELPGLVIRRNKERNLFLLSA